MENNEKLDWKPEIGKTAWLMAGNSLTEVMVLGEFHNIGGGYRIGYRGCVERLCATHLLFPTPEEALASIRVYDLEGKEVLIPPRPLVLEPKPLEWHHREMNEEAVAVDGDWSFYAWNNGDWSIHCDGVEVAMKWGNENDDLDFDTAKAAIHEWRVNHLKSMLP